jgi:hypothetical protein
VPTMANRVVHAIWVGSVATRGKKKTISIRKSEFCWNYHLNVNLLLVNMKK